MQQCPGIGIKYTSVASRAATRPPAGPSIGVSLSIEYVLEVLLVRLGFRNKTGFHECPQCKSRSVWKADPYGPLEETLHRLLRLSPYRCARCDKRFMDSKIPVPGAQPRLMRRWLSRASRLLHRRPFDEALRLYSIFSPPLSTPAGSIAPRLVDRSTSRPHPPGSESSGVAQNSGVRA